MAAEAGNQGEIHLVCDADDGPYYVKSLDSGETFTSPIKVVQGAPRIDGLEFQTWDMAIGGLGWQVYDAKGKAVGSPGESATTGNGVAGAVTKRGELVLFH